MARHPRCLGGREKTSVVSRDLGRRLDKSVELALSTWTTGFCPDTNVPVYIRPNMTVGDNFDKGTYALIHALCKNTGIFPMLCLLEHVLPGFIR